MYIKTPVGTIFFVDLTSASGHCIGKIRPCVVVENDRATVTVYAITDDDGCPYHSDIPIPLGVGNLKKPSKIKMGQVITIDRDKVLYKVGELPDKYLIDIQDYIKNRGILKKIDNILKKRKIDNIKKEIYRNRFNSRNNK